MFDWLFDSLYKIQPIVESMYKSRCWRFAFGIWTCAKLKRISRIQDVCSSTFPQDECTWFWTSKRSKVVLKKWGEEVTWNKMKWNIFFLIKFTTISGNTWKQNTRKLRDCRQITFITLNGFCLLSEKNPTPPVLNGQYQNG